MLNHKLIEVGLPDYHVHGSTLLFCSLQKQRIMLAVLHISKVRIVRIFSCQNYY